MIYCFAVGGPEYDVVCVWSHSRHGFLVSGEFHHVPDVCVWKFVRNMEWPSNIVQEIIIRRELRSMQHNTEKQLDDIIKQWTPPCTTPARHHLYSACPASWMSTTVAWPFSWGSPIRPHHVWLVLKLCGDKGDCLRGPNSKQLRLLYPGSLIRYDYWTSRTHLLNDEVTQSHTRWWYVETEVAVARWWGFKYRLPTERELSLVDEKILCLNEPLNNLQGLKFEYESVAPKCQYYAVESRQMSRPLR